MYYLNIGVITKKEKIKMYTNHTLYFWGVPIEEITRDVKDGKFILKTQGNINNDVKAQTVIFYGNVTNN